MVATSHGAKTFARRLIVALFCKPLAVIARSRVVPGSLVCSAGHVCEPSLAALPPWEWGVGRFLSSDVARRRLMVILERFQYKLARGVPPVILHIGPNELTRSEVLGYRLLLRLAKGLCRLIFVEPLAPVLASLKKRMRFAEGANHTVDILSSAVCPSSLTSTEETLYTFSSELLQDFPDIPRDIFGDLSSLSKEQFYASILRFGGGRNFPRMSIKDWEDSRYVEKIAIRCLTPSALLAKLSLRPEDVDYFISDTEGYDTSILPEFLELDNFAPAVLSFEHVNQRLHINATFEVVRQLVARDYDVHAHFLDVIAIHSRDMA